MSETDSFPHRHPIITNILINVFLLLILVIILELVLRLFVVNYSIDFYTGTHKEGVVHYPYGDIVINSLGFADEEFDLDDARPRIGYSGDSVNYGVGAGYPYRFSDLNEAPLPEYAHWNLGGGVGGDLESNSLLRNAAEYNLSYAVYLLNMNDIGPVSSAQRMATGTTKPKEEADLAESVVREIKRIVSNFDALRGRSYLYNYLRLKFKNVLQLAGFEASGYRAYELWPNENRAVFENFADRVNLVAKQLAEQDVTLCVVLLPYEMQTSADAAQVYSEMGFSWEEGFTEGSAQSLIKELLNFPYVYDPLSEFDRDNTKVGEQFVYDKGDKIDWNHPNRAGHKVISDGFLKSKACPFVE